MATDVFNNPSNDYVYPALSPCAGSGSDSNLEFIDDGIGIISGSDILAKIDFSSISIPVSAYSVETKILGEREVTYIPGLTKGLSLKQQGFQIPNISSHDEDLNSLFYHIDLSINYYQGFQYTFTDVSVSADYGQNINLEDALNIAFGDLGIRVESIYDPSTLIFKGTLEGYDFTVSNVVLTTIPSSDPSVFDTEISYPLTEDPSLFVPYAKYPNGGMQGIIMKGIYPSSTPMDPYDHWVYINQVSDVVAVYSPIEIANYLNEIKVDFSPGITFGPFVGDVSTALEDLTLDTIIIGPGDAINDCSILGCTISDSSIWASRIFWTDFTGSAIENSEVNIFSVDASERSTITGSIINDSSVWNTTITDTSIYNSILYDVSIIGCTLYNCTEEELVDKENTTDIYIDPSIGIESTVIDSSTYYTKALKRVDVGMNGCSTLDIMSAGDYLQWVTDNNYWKKFGDMFIWTSAPDGCSSCYNLLDGFYVYNPHAFDIKIEYMLFI